MERVETVTGAISPNDLGITLPHEHLLVDFRSLVQEPEKASEKWIVDVPISLVNLEMFTKRRDISKDNLHLTDIATAIFEVNEFKHAGGQSLVEVTPIGCGRDPLGLKKIAEATRINILCPTGWYKQPNHPSYIKEKSIDELSSFMVNELTEGIDDSNIKAGIIKCACNTPIHPDENKVLQAAAITQQKTGAPLSIHPYRLPVTSKPIEGILDTIVQEGANLEKTSICHTDVFLFRGKGWTLPLDYHISLMDHYYITLNFDMFGKNQYYEFPAVFWNDRKRVAAVVELCHQGYDKQIQLSHDRCYKMHLKSYGGYGYAQIVKYIIPELKYQGVSDNQIKNLLSDNSKRMLAY